MNTKNFVAILMASIIAMAMFAPTATAMAKDIGTVVEVVVPNEDPYICCKWEEPEVVEPNPWKPVPVTIHACVCDPNGEGDIDTVTAYTPKGTITLDRHPETDRDCERYECEPAPSIPCVEYSGTFEMEPCDPAGKYAITVIATDKSGAKSNTVTNEFEYLSIIYLDMDFEEINYGEVELGEKKYVSPGYIHNMGNDKMRISISATAMTDNGIDSGIILDAEVGDEEYDLLPPDVPVEFKHMFECCRETPINFSIFVPFGTPPGSYSGKITIEGVHVVECTETIDLGSATGPGDDCQYPSGVLPDAWDWSDKVATTHTGGNYGGIGDCGARMVLGANRDPEDPGKPWALVRFSEECRRNCLQAITVKHLDGIADDSFDVYVNKDHIGSYAWSKDKTEYWVVSTFPVPYGEYHCPVEVRLEATGDPWENYEKYGQLAIDWIKMTCCESCEEVDEYE
jgi:hypothetical protein